MFLAVTTSDTQITNLLHLYAELMDAGRLEECCDLFADARVVLDAEADPPVVVDRDGLMQVWRSLVAIYDDGTPRTRHLVATPILEVDAEAGDLGLPFVQDEGQDEWEQYMNWESDDVERE